MRLDAARRAAEELDRVVEAARSEGARLDEARFIVDRISEVNPLPGELEELEESLPRAEHAESLASCAHDAQAALSDEGGALDALNTAIAELVRMGAVDQRLSSFADVLSEASILIEDSASDLRRYRDDIEFDPAQLARSQERLSELRSLCRQFGPTMDDVFSRLAGGARDLLSLVDDAEGRERRARAALSMPRRSSAVPPASSLSGATRPVLASAGRSCARWPGSRWGRPSFVWESRELA